MKKWQLNIYNKKGKRRAIPLDHDYNTADEANREAENIADILFTENDEDWTVTERTRSKKNG